MLSALPLLLAVASAFDLGSEMFDGHLPQACFLKLGRNLIVLLKHNACRYKGWMRNCYLTAAVATATNSKGSFPLYFLGLAWKYSDLSWALAGKSSLPKTSACSAAD